MIFLLKRSLLNAVLDNFSKCSLHTPQIIYELTIFSAESVSEKENNILTDYDELSDSDLTIGETTDHERKCCYQSWTHNVMNYS